MTASYLCSAMHANKKNAGEARRHVQAAIIEYENQHVIVQQVTEHQAAECTRLT
ncbi:hypothetical protein IF2G_06731 [Cordyceps javanica]|nr:hypothetical protein IF2G_06731 [Cordyceps javanica]